MKFKQLFIFSALLTATPVMAAITLSDAQVREMPPGVPNTAAYLTLHNDGEATALVGASCDIAANTEIHTMLTENGMMKMRRIDRVDLPAGQSVSLHQGGDHLMLLQLTRQPLAGQRINCILTFASGASLSATLPVVEMKSAGHEHHQHH
ncbi:copper chaperone PCu(A)C [Ferrimonas sediminicola]|uniref:Copper chaperone PCu(A)C n=1 Tax=Ferrimonas sediminicola TaxID=2569538 RepID=A0A4U1BIS3_9GAMM|nr:copper chaperone PCu(A)C [Ferrimonas sediminicola]TKB51406.1 copper chaperone PCu(A)C [Ferrimonas sediminicola]